MHPGGRERLGGVLATALFAFGGSLAQAATGSAAEDSRQFESPRRRRRRGRGLSPVPGAAVRRAESGWRSGRAGRTAAGWGGLSGTGRPSASGAKPPLAKLRSVGPAGDISWEPHCSCDLPLSFLNVLFVWRRLSSQRQNHYKIIKSIIYVWSPNSFKALRSTACPLNLCHGWTCGTTLKSLQMMTRGVGSSL